jgi:hypothetical protein
LAGRYLFILPVRAVLTAPGFGSVCGGAQQHIFIDVLGKIAIITADFEWNPVVDL